MPDPFSTATTAAESLADSAPGGAPAVVGSAVGTAVAVVGVAALVQRAFPGFWPAVASIRIRFPIRLALADDREEALQKRERTFYEDRIKELAAENDRLEAEYREYRIKTADTVEVLRRDQRREQDECHKAILSLREETAALRERLRAAEHVNEWQNSQMNAFRTALLEHGLISDGGSGLLRVPAPIRQPATEPDE